MWYTMEDMKDLTLEQVITWIASGAIIFGGIVPYIPQYRDIRRTRSCEGFSQHTCLVLLVANMLRIFFWFGKHFELPLLAQSFLMVSCMMTLMEICVRVQNQSEIVQTRQHHFKDPVPRVNFYQTMSDMDWKFFWRWSDFLSYVECMLILAGVLSITTYLLLDSPTYVETIGFLAVFIEALLGAPQLLKNWKRGSAQGMNVMMVIMWMCGDVFKTIYFVTRQAPIQFWICGSLQIAVDVAILLQVLYYSLTRKSHT